jgi:hypothetical protein
MDDRVLLMKERFSKKVFGKLFGDKVYISKQLFEILFSHDLQLVIGSGNKM